MAVIAVRDHGIGIAPRTRRGSSSGSSALSRRATTPEVGIGLFIARQIVEAHGGSIRVESALGMGSTFVVELPIEHVVEPLEATRTRPERKRSQAKRRAPERTVSVVEDDVELSAGLADLLDKPSIP